MKKAKHKKKTSPRKPIRIIFGIVFLISITATFFMIKQQKKEKVESQNILDNIEVNETEITEEKTQRMLQIQELQKENKEIIGWLEIEGTSINYPVCQTTDNDYYLTHNYKKEESSSGSLFLDKGFDLINGSSNYLIYGHRNKQGIMFEDLIKYVKESFYNEHKIIKFTTTSEDKKYEILSVFYSRVYYKTEQNVFRYYYFVNAENEGEYNEFVNNAKKASIYNTGVTAKFGEQLLTLSTCEYSQEDGRFVIVAKEIE